MTEQYEKCSGLTCDKYFSFEDCHGMARQCEGITHKGKCSNRVCDALIIKCEHCYAEICHDCTNCCFKCGLKFCSKCSDDEMLRCKKCNELFCSKCSKYSSGEPYCHNCNPYKEETEQNELTFELIKIELDEYIPSGEYYSHLPDDTIKKIDVDYLNSIDDELDDIEELLDEVLSRSS